MDRWIGKVSVVTGASAGIGAAVCENFVKHGLNVVGLARREHRILELSNKLNGERGQLYPVKCDVTKQDEVEKTFKWIKENVGLVQILVNCAGVFRIGTLIESNPDDLRTILDTNIMSICLCTREGYKQMKENDLEGHIVHINSTGGHWHYSENPPILNLYSPSKHAVTVMTEIMRREIVAAGTKVKISSVSPGEVATEMIQAAGVEISDDQWAQLPRLSASDVADTVEYVISTPSNVLIQDVIIRPMGEGPTI